MKQYFFAVCCAILLSSCGQHISKIDSVDIVPKVNSLVLSDSTFNLSATTSIRLMANDSAMYYSANFFNGILERTLGKKLPVNRTDIPTADAINIGLNESYALEEYRISIRPEMIIIEGGSPAGVFYGFQTLRQILPVTTLKGEKAQVIELPTLEIRDKPFFAYRGSMLDVCRHFFSVEDIKTHLDMLAMHKINMFHWHLTDDQGWRIEIKEYPNLTVVGSVRSKTLLNHALDSVHVYDNTPYGGFYTQDEVREIVRYAQERFITVIPEIEMPGHAQAALASYPELGCLREGYEVSTMWGIMEEAFCAGKETTFTFLENVLSEVMELFPSPYIHLGGDECLKHRWEECPFCQKRIQDEGLANVDQLQSYFMQRVERFVNSKGRRIIGWDEILDGGISRSATVMSWRESRGGITAARNGNYAIMAPNTHCYLDYYQTADHTYEPLAIGGNLPVEKVYELDPYERLNNNQRTYILGPQANLWTEYIPNLNHAQYMLLPRLAAIAETGWSYGQGKDFDDFKRRLTTLRDYYMAEGYNFGNHLWTTDSTAVTQ